MDLSTDLKERFDETMKEFIRPEMQEIRAILKRIELKLDLKTKTALLNLDMTILGSNEPFSVRLDTVEETPRWVQ
jgi:hypothetical protein